MTGRISWLDRWRMRAWIKRLHLAPDEVEEFKTWWAERAAARREGRELTDGWDDL